MKRCNFPDVNVFLRCNFCSRSVLFLVHPQKRVDVILLEVAFFLHGYISPSYISRCNFVLGSGVSMANY